MRLNKNYEKFSEFAYPKKYSDTDTSSHDRLLNVLKKLDTSHKPMIQKMHEPFIEGNHNSKCFP